MHPIKKNTQTKYAYKITSGVNYINSVVNL